MSPTTPVVVLLSLALFGLNVSDAEGQNAHRRADLQPVPQVALRPVAKIVVNGKAVAGLVLSREPYARGDGPSVCSGMSQPGARTEDGTPISALEFIGWEEGDGYRITAYAIVQNDPVGASTACEGPRLEFDSVHLGFGQERLLARMEEANVTPWTIRVEAWEGVQENHRPHRSINVSFAIRR